MQQFILHKKFYYIQRIKVAAILKRDFRTEISVGMAGRIITYLIKRNSIKPASFYYAKKRVRPRTFDKHAQRWKRNMKGKKPGEYIQIDHMSATITLVAIASFLHAVKITDASFTLEHRAQSVKHKLRVSFTADDKTTKYTFAFQPITAIEIENEAYCHYSRDCIDEGTPGIVDLWPVNATYCKRSFTHKLFV